MTTAQGCILELTNLRTGRVSYGCAGEEPWLREKPIPIIREVDTLDEAAKHPILDESRAAAWAETMVAMYSHLRYRVRRPQPRLREQRE